LIGSPVTLYFESPGVPMMPAMTSPPWMPTPKRSAGSALFDRALPEPAAQFGR